MNTTSLWVGLLQQGPWHHLWHIITRWWYTCCSAVVRLGVKEVCLQPLPLLVGLILVKEWLSWLQRCHCLANQRSKKVPCTRYYRLMENPKSQVEQSRCQMCDGNRISAKRNFTVWLEVIFSQKTRHHLWVQFPVFLNSMGGRSINECAVARRTITLRSCHVQYFTSDWSQYWILASAIALICCHVKRPQTVCFETVTPSSISRLRVSF